MVGDRERRRQARQFDPEEVDQPGDAVLARPLDHEILRGDRRRHDLRADAGIAGSSAPSGSAGQ